MVLDAARADAGTARRPPRARHPRRSRRGLHTLDDPARADLLARAGRRSFRGRTRPEQQGASGPQASRPAGGARARPRSRRPGTVPGCRRLAVLAEQYDVTRPRCAQRRPRPHRGLAHARPSGGRHAGPHVRSSRRMTPEQLRRCSGRLRSRDDDRRMAGAHGPGGPRRGPRRAAPGILASLDVLTPGWCRSAGSPVTTGRGWRKATTTSCRSVCWCGTQGRRCSAPGRACCAPARSCARWAWAVERRTAPPLCAVVRAARLPCGRCAGLPRVRRDDEAYRLLRVAGDRMASQGDAADIVTMLIARAHRRLARQRRTSAAGGGPATRGPCRRGSGPSDATGRGLGTRYRDVRLARGLAALHDTRSEFVLGLAALDDADPGEVAQSGLAVRWKALRATMLSHLGRSEEASPRSGGGARAGSAIR